MASITTVDDIQQLGTILCVWAHPDDETFSCAGIMAAAIGNGQKVACITATKGEAGVQDAHRWPADKLGDIRADEMAKALACIGCQNHSWLGYRDGACHEISDEVGASRVREYIDRYQPDTILTFGPDGLTGHTDHQAVSRWATLAASDNTQVYYAVEEESVYIQYLEEADKKFNIYFNTDKPPILLAEKCVVAFELTPALLQMKEHALRSMPSQFEKFFQDSTDDFLQKVLGLECFVKAPK